MAAGSAKAGTQGARRVFADSADVVDVEAVLHFTEMDGGGGADDDAVGREGLDALVFGKGLVPADSVRVLAGVT